MQLLCTEEMVDANLFLVIEFPPVHPCHCFDPIWPFSVGGLSKPPITMCVCVCAFSRTVRRHQRHALKPCQAKVLHHDQSHKDTAFCVQCGGELYKPNGTRII